MAWCRQEVTHYPSQCWPRSTSPYCITGPQWVKTLALWCHIHQLFLHVQIYIHYQWVLIPHHPVLTVQYIRIYIYMFQVYRDCSSWQLPLLTPLLVVVVSLDHIGCLLTWYIYITLVYLVQGENWTILAKNLALSPKSKMFLFCI